MNANPEKSLPKSHITVPFKECQLEVSDSSGARIRKVTNIIFIDMNMKMMHCFCKFLRERKDIHLVLETLADHKARRKLPAMHCIAMMNNEM